MFGVLVVVVGRSPIDFCAWLAAVVVIPGGVSLWAFVSILKSSVWLELDYVLGFACRISLKLEGRRNWQRKAAWDLY